MSKNSLASAIQILIFAFLQLVLYKVVIMKLGIEKVGLWSIVTSFSTAANFGNFGASGSNVVMFIAKHLAVNDYSKIKKIISTSIIFNFFSISLTLLILYPISLHFFFKMLSAEDFKLASTDLLYLSYINFGLYSVGFLLWSVVDGFQLFTKRALFYSMSQVGSFILSVVFMNYWNLQGLFFAQILQNVFLLITGAIVVNRLSPIRLIFCRVTLKEILSYGVQLQLLSISNLFFEPVIKYFITRYAGIAMTGYFELSYKITNQIRSPLLATMQPLVPLVAQVADNRNKIKQYYLNTVDSVIQMILLLTSVFLICLPLIGHFWIGSIHPMFLWMAVSLSIGCLFNTLAAPICSVSYGIGNLRLNFIQSVFQLTFMVLCLVLGGTIAPMSIIIISLGVGISTAAFLIVVLFHRDYEIPIMNTFFKNKVIWLSVIFSIFMLLFLYKVLFDRVGIITFTTITFIATAFLLRIFFLDFLLKSLKKFIR